MLLVRRLSVSGPLTVDSGDLIEAIHERPDRALSCTADGSTAGGTAGLARLLITSLGFSRQIARALRQERAREGPPDAELP